MTADFWLAFLILLATVAVALGLVIFVTLWSERDQRRFMREIEMRAAATEALRRLQGRDDD